LNPGKTSEKSVEKPKENIQVDDSDKTLSLDDSESNV
jgi:hypothetical protein